MRRIFLPFASEATLPAAASLFPAGAAVFFTVTDAGSAPSVHSALEGLGLECAGWSVTEDGSLELCAPAVVECAEKLGGIDELIFAPELSTTATLFLDLPEDEFIAHTSAIEAIFGLCKCALPYMMGADGAAVRIMRPKERGNLTSSVYNAAISAMAERMNAELTEYGVRTEIF